MKKHQAQQEGEEMQTFITAKEVAALLRKSEAWILRQARAGLIPAFQIGQTWLFTEADIEHYLESKRKGSKYQPPSEESETVNAGRNQAASAVAGASKQPSSKRGRPEIIFDKINKTFSVKYHPPS